METSCRSTEGYLARWRSHGAFQRAWNADVEAYARYDMVQEGPIVRCVVNPDAVQADGFDLMFDGRTRSAITRVRSPISLLRATHGADGENEPMIPLAQLDEFVAGHPHVRVEHVADTNHYTLLLGESRGPARVAAAIECPPLRQLTSHQGVTSSASTRVGRSRLDARLTLEGHIVVVKHRRAGAPAVWIRSNYRHVVLREAPS